MAGRLIAVHVALQLHSADSPHLTGAYKFAAVQCSARVFRPQVSLRSWRDFARECFCFGNKVVNGSGKGVRGLGTIQIPSQSSPARHKAWNTALGHAG